MEYTALQIAGNLAGIVCLVTGVLIVWIGCTILFSDDPELKELRKRILNKGKNNAEN